MLGSNCCLREQFKTRYPHAQVFLIKMNLSMSMYNRQTTEVRGVRETGLNYIRVILDEQKIYGTADSITFLIKFLICTLVTFSFIGAFRNSFIFRQIAYKFMATAQFLT